MISDIFSGTGSVTDWLELAGAVLAVIIAWLQGRKTGRDERS